jgi:hypothetical protein
MTDCILSRFYEYLVSGRVDERDARTVDDDLISRVVDGVAEMVVEQRRARHIDLTTGCTGSWHLMPPSLWGEKAGVPGSVASRRRFVLNLTPEPARTTKLSRLRPAPNSAKDQRAFLPVADTVSSAGNGGRAGWVLNR